MLGGYVVVVVGDVGVVGGFVVEVFVEEFVEEFVVGDVGVEFNWL